MSLSHSFLTSDILPTGALWLSVIKIVLPGVAAYMMAWVITRSLRQKEMQLQRILDSVPVGMAYIDRERRYKFVNLVYEQRLKRPKSDILGKYVWEVVGKANYESARSYIDTVLSGKAVSCEFEFQYAAGESSYLLATFNPDIDVNNSVKGYFLAFSDITKRRQVEEALAAANQELYRLANLDGLTQIANRRLFDQYFEKEWRRLARDLKPLSLILLDVDDFKSYNDFYGHQAGDECLIKLAQLLRKSVMRPADQVARYGGEEFVVVLPNTDEKGAIAIAERIQADLAALAIPHERSSVGKQVTFSLGICTMHASPTQQPDYLLTLTDQALYTAKQNGKNCYTVAQKQCTASSAFAVPPGLDSKSSVPNPETSPLG